RGRAQRLDPLQRLLQKRRRADQCQELLRLFLPAARPKPRASPASHDECVQHWNSYMIHEGHEEHEEEEMEINFIRGFPSCPSWITPYLKYVSFSIRAMPWTFVRSSAASSAKSGLISSLTLAPTSAPASLSHAAARSLIICWAVAGQSTLSSFLFL